MSITVIMIIVIVLLIILGGVFAFIYINEETPVFTKPASAQPAPVSEPTKPEPIKPPEPIPVQAPAYQTQTVNIKGSVWDKVEDWELPHGRTPPLPFDYRYGAISPSGRIKENYTVDKCIDDCLANRNCIGIRYKKGQEQECAWLVRDPNSKVPLPEMKMNKGVVSMMLKPGEREKVKYSAVQIFGL